MAPNPLFRIPDFFCIFQTNFAMHCNPLQGQYRVQYFHTGKTLFYYLAGILVMKTGFSLLEILHRENSVLITGMGLQCSLQKSSSN